VEPGDNVELDEDDRPPICPACGVTMGIVESDGKSRYVCLECGFSDEEQGSV
jgi:tRNA(Ile2) C34 agmatinyltransferase TiaS